MSEYAYRYSDKAVIWQPERGVIAKFRQLVGLRKRLLNAKSALKVPLHEVAEFQDKKLQKEMEKLNHDFYGLCKCWHIIFFIFSVISHTCKYSVNDLIANCI